MGDSITNRDLPNDQEAIKEVSLEKVLSVVRRQYSQRMRGQARYVTSKLEEARHGDSFCLDDLRRHVHQLAGTAASYGFSKVSQAARSIEEAIVQQESSSILKELQQLCTQLELAVGQDCAGFGLATSGGHPRI